MEDGGREVLSSAARFWHRKLAADFPGKVFANLDVAGHRFDRAVGWVYPERVFAAFTLQPAAVGLQVPEQIAAFHQTRTKVCSAPRGAVSRLCSRR